MRYELMSYVLFAIPFFFLLIGLELVLDKVRNTQYYRLNDAVNSLTIGVISRMNQIARSVIPISMYALSIDYISLTTLPDAPWVWVMAFVLYDFCYYWNHRMGHEINVLWAAHVVHHSSEEYNLTTALRQTSGGFVGWIFYLPMALIGVPVTILITVGSLNLIYQFWVHTRHVPKLGWFEWIFVTPSNHRVHHAQNQVYIDRNYGGVFILWDRLFGTFQEELENEPPIYGIRKALHSWNPLWANVHVYVQLAKDSFHTRNWKNKIAIWFRPTGWRPADVEQQYPLPRADLTQFKKFDINLPVPIKFYAAVQHILTLIIAVLFLINYQNMPELEKWLVLGFVIFSSFSIGGLMEKRHYSLALEWIKNILACAALALYDLPNWFEWVIGSATVLSFYLLWVATREHQPISESAV
ncbi:sterol desaturase family protein [Neptunicella sp. SCSIO 80796]|uniref:sterol desaturase family protein n=1 Tax=Neptunicella plasticusilytica TaxID=3117012 RepID=UPI003A4D853F